MIIKCRLSSEKLILESPEVVTSDPLNFHVIVRELLEELQNNVTFSPSLTVTVSGCSLVEGFSVRGYNYFSFTWYSKVFNNFTPTSSLEAF